MGRPAGGGGTLRADPLRPGGAGHPAAGGRHASVRPRALSHHQSLRGGAGYLCQAGKARLHRQGRPGEGPAHLPPPGGPEDHRPGDRPGGVPGVRRGKADRRGHLGHPLSLAGSGGCHGHGGRGL